MQAAVILQHVTLIRQWLAENKLDAFIVPHEDEFLGEYIPEHNERLHWLTGFTGSAGAAVITLDQAAIFVDGRYTVQVTKQTPADIFSYHHLIQEPPLAWVKQNLAQGAKVGIDPRMHTATWLEKASSQIAKGQSLVSLAQNPIDQSWDDRPQAIESDVRLMPTQAVGVDCPTKRRQIATLIKQKDADAALLTQLDSICWLLNIRGADVSRLPVILSHAILHRDTSVDVFIKASRLPAEAALHFGENVRVHEPKDLESVLESLKDKHVLFDSNTANAWFKQTLTQIGAICIESADPCLLPKAAKNSTEAKGMRDCHVRDGVAMVKFLSWLDDEVAQGNLHDEGTLADTLESFRREDESLMDLSFDTISAAGSNAAMCHYNHQNQEEYGKLSQDSLYLVDSGGQYLDGTTDITRTIAIGNPSPFMKQQFTLVLKGHIALASAKFPKGTTGSQLDILARQYLWQQGYNFDHGTGHGVGHFLSVHEGPQRISPAYNPISLEEGMVLSNEPGYYEADKFGIRIENLEIVTKQHVEGPVETLGFESLTRCPIDVRAIDFSLLTTDEKAWLNQYHEKVWQDLSPLVQGAVKAWLEEATAEI